jgi:hypothetical protein
VQISAEPSASGKVSRPNLTPWERLGLPPADSVAIQAALGAITAATETPTYGAAMCSYMDDNTRMKSRRHADGYFRREQIAHKGWKEHRDTKIAQRENSDHDSADYYSEPEFQVTRALGYHPSLGKPKPVKLTGDETPVNQDVLRIAGRVYVKPDLGSHVIGDDGDADESDMGTAARYMGHRQLSLCMIGAAMRGSRPWFTLDLFACHMFGLVDAPTLAKRIGRSAAVVRGQLVAAYARMARARADAARGNKDARDMLAIMIEVSVKGSAFERGDLTAILLTGEMVPRQIYMGDSADAAAGLAALQTALPMLASYRHPEAVDAASELASRRTVPVDVVAARVGDAARTVTREERAATAHLQKRDDIARHAEKWEKEQRATSALDGLEHGLYVGRTFKTKQQREDEAKEKALASASEFTGLGTSHEIERAEERAARKARANIRKKIGGREIRPTLEGVLPQQGIIGRVESSGPPNDGALPITWSGDAVDVSFPSDVLLADISTLKGSSNAAVSARRSGCGREGLLHQDSS